MMRTRKIGTLLGAVFACAMPVSAAPSIRVMLLDGEQAGAYHAWQETTPYLKRMLDDAGIFQVDIVTAPARNGDFTAFKPEWGKYQVVVANYDAPDERWARQSESLFRAIHSQRGRVRVCPRRR